MAAWHTTHDIQRHSLLAQLVEDCTRCPWMPLRQAQYHYQATKWKMHLQRHHYQQQQSLWQMRKDMSKPAFWPSLLTNGAPLCHSICNDSSGIICPVTRASQTEIDDITTRFMRTDQSLNHQIVWRSTITTKDSPSAQSDLWSYARKVLFFGGFQYRILNGPYNTHKHLVIGGNNTSYMRSMTCWFVRQMSQFICSNWPCGLTVSIFTSI